MPRLSACLCAAVLVAGRAVGAELDFSLFEAKIRPVLVERCYECHGETKQKGGLRLDSKAALLKGGDSGPIVVPGMSSTVRGPENGGCWAPPSIPAWRSQ